MRRRGSRNVFLVGFMAAGKTRVGRALARRLGRRFVDADLEIERSEGRAVPEIFALRGEAHFRRLEARTIARIARDSGQVVAVGGGAAMDAGNVASMRGSGVVIYLETPFGILFGRAERQGRASRPVWRGATREARRRGMARLYAERRGAYRRAAHIVLRPRDLSARAVAARAARRLGRVERVRA